MNKEYPCKDCLFIITCRENCPEASRIILNMIHPKDDVCSYCSNNLIYYGVSRRKCAVCGALFYD